jgi:hypothetical protein
MAEAGSADGTPSSSAQEPTLASSGRLPPARESHAALGQCLEDPLDARVLDIQQLGEVVPMDARLQQSEDPILEFVEPPHPLSRYTRPSRGGVRRTT